MYRVVKVLNNNGIIAFEDKSKNETIILAKGIGFGRKVNERINLPDKANVYVLQKETDRGNSIDIINSVQPVFLEIANEIIVKVESAFGNVNKDILLLLTDHIAFAVKRINSGMRLDNPFTRDIRAMFPREYGLALEGKKIIFEHTGCEINDDEVGYITLHIHSAIEQENVSESMMVAMTIRECIETIENDLNIKIDVKSLSYERLMTHIKHMITRAIRGEKIQLDMNDYIKKEFPKAYEFAEVICHKCAKQLKKEFSDVEIGYLAMHIERVYKDEGARLK